MLVNGKSEINYRPHIQVEMNLPFEWQSTNLGKRTEREAMNNPKWKRMFRLSRNDMYKHVMKYIDVLKDMCCRYNWSFGIMKEGWLIYIRKFSHHKFIYALCVLVAEKTTWPLELVIERCGYDSSIITKNYLRKILIENHIQRPKIHDHFYLDKLLDMPAIDVLRKWNPRFYVDFDIIRREVIKTHPSLVYSSIATIAILANIYNSPLGLNQFSG